MDASKSKVYTDVSYDPSLVSAVQHGTWMDEEGFKKTCIKEKRKRGSRLHAETGCRKVYAGEVSE